MVIIDVREKEEFEAEHIPESILCPLSQFNLLAPGILKNIKMDEEIILICRSDNRARIALTEIRKLGYENHKLTVYEGGILKWSKEGLPTRGKGMVFPIMRQVQIVAALMIFLGFGLHFFVDQKLVYIALLPGFGLALSGFVGVCPMVYILQKMPWNNKKMNDFKVSHSNNCCR